MDWLHEDLGLRRIPVQARSRERLEAILDAAAECFVEVGVDQATMESIAARAGSSIGAVYQFFPDKRVLFRALAERSLARSRVVFETMLSSGDLGASWTGFLDAVIDGYVAFEHADVGFRAIWANLNLYHEFAEAEQDFYAVQVSQTQGFVALLGPRLSERQQHVVATHLVDTINAAIFNTARKPPDMVDELIAETKVMLRRYLTPYFE